MVQEKKAGLDRVNRVPLRLKASTRQLFARSWAFEVAFAALTIAAAALILSLVGRQSGWPTGQAFSSPFILTQMYAAHFRHHDFFPIWSSSDAYGMGSPVLLYYQKTFFYVSGLFYILTGNSLKSAFVLSIALFLIIGSYGMRAALGTITRRKLLVTVGALGFLFSNYVFTDWLVRGDLPEFTALMLVPWLLYWCLNLVINRRVSFVLIPTLVLLVNAHNAIALVSVFTLLITFTTFAATAGLAGLRAVFRRLFIAVGGATVLLAPILLAELRFSAFYDPAAKVDLPAANESVFQNFYRPIAYLYNSSYHWLRDTHNARRPIGVQIDFSIWIPIALAVLAGLTLLVASRMKRTHSGFGRYFNGPAMVVLLASFGLYLFLQLSASADVYRVLKPLMVIDYPYRMLALITPLGIIIVIALAEALYRRYGSGHRRLRNSRILSGLSVVWLGSIILLSPLTSTFRIDYGPLVQLASGGNGPVNKYAFPPTSLWDRPQYTSYLSAPASAIDNEYLPKLVDSTGKELTFDYPIYQRLSSLYALGRGSIGACSVVEPSNTPLESLQLTFTVRCSRPTRLGLPISYNADTQILVKGPRGTLRNVPYTHIPTDPRIFISVPNSQPESLVVNLPTLWRTLF